LNHDAPTLKSPESANYYNLMVIPEKRVLGKTKSMNR
jgi:hypothetical protein